MKIEEKQQVRIADGRVLTVVKSAVIGSDAKPIYWCTGEGFVHGGKWFYAEDLTVIEASK
jgi:hypothetical protein